MSTQSIDMVVLAGERPGGNALAQALGIPSALLAELAGKAVISWTFQGLFESHHARVILVGPDAELVNQHLPFSELTQDPRVHWQAPMDGPAASAVAGIKSLGRVPALLTAADHALLQGQWVDEFVEQARKSAQESGADVTIGLVPYDIVKARFPQSKRTQLRFSDRSYCGSNLFLIHNERGLKGLEFWRRIESHRKSPWRMASILGWGLCVRYLLGRLTLADALNALGSAAGCEVRQCELSEPCLAVDVDSLADFELANSLLSPESNSQS